MLQTRETLLLLAQDKNTKLGWAFKKTYMHGKFTVTKYNSDQGVQMENILTFSLRGKLICHKTKAFVNYYIHTWGKEDCQDICDFICLLIIISIGIQIPGHQHSILLILPSQTYTCLTHIQSFTATRDNAKRD